MLPPLRQELALYPGPNTYSGEPTWSLHDPIRNLFFRLDWLSFEIIARWSLGDPQRILECIEDDTPIQAEIEDIKLVLRFLLDNELLQPLGQEDTARLHQERLKRNTHFIHWLIHRYLFFRIPLFKPDNWLKKTQKLASPLYSNSFIWLTLTALLFGLIEISRQWETFIATLVDLFSWSGAISFAIALLFVKLMHELGHAFTAKRFGCRVPTMGVAFLVMFPMAYTDVNEVWKLRSKRQRLLIGAAGINTELIIAAWATLFWTLLPDGPLRGAVFILATTTWVSTLIINASPFLRFDGYFLLMDWLGMPNLHQRAFALGKWALRKTLFGFNDDPPEILPKKHQRGLIFFAYTTWLYRLLIFTGIALLVYFSVPKPLGPILAAIELWWFIVQPVLKEMRAWLEQIHRIVKSQRIRWILVLLALTLTIILLPWDSRIHSQGLLIPENYFPLVSPEQAKLITIKAIPGKWVEKGEIVLELELPDLDYRKEITEARIQILRWKSTAAGVSDEFLEKIQTLEAERAKLKAELISLQEKKSQLQIRAPIPGLFFPSNVDLHPNVWIEQNENLGTIINPDAWQVITYLPESEIERIKHGDLAFFYADSGDSKRLRLRLSRIDFDATRLLNDALLASSKGGHIPVRETSYGLIPELAVYRIVLSLEPGQSQDLTQLQRGKLILFGKRRSWAGEYLQRALAVIVRESGF